MPENDLKSLIINLHKAQDSGNKKKEADALFELAKYHYEDENYDKAKLLLNEINLIDSKYPSLNYQLALIALQQNNYEKARNYLKKEIKINPKNQIAKTLIEKIQIKTNYPFITISIFILCSVMFYFTSPQISIIQMMRYGVDNSMLSIGASISSLFFHYNMVHFSMNMAILLSFGLLLEKKIGSLPYLLIYVASGIVGNIAQSLFTQDGGFIIGASSALFGILGAFLMKEPLLKVRLFGIIKMPLILFLGAFFGLIEIVYTFLNFSFFLGDIAHISGLFIGIIIAVALYNETQNVFYYWFVILTGFFGMSIGFKNIIIRYSMITFQEIAIYFGLVILSLIVIIYSYDILKVKLVGEGLK